MHCGYIFQQPENGHGCYGFTGAGLAHQCMGLPLFNGQIDIVQYLCVTADLLIRAEGKREVIYSQQFVHV